MGTNVYAVSGCGNQNNTIVGLSSATLMVGYVYRSRSLADFFTVVLHSVPTDFFSSRSHLVWNINHIIWPNVGGAFIHLAMLRIERDSDCATGITINGAQSIQFTTHNVAKKENKNVSRSPMGKGTSNILLLAKKIMRSIDAMFCPENWITIVLLFVDLLQYPVAITADLNAHIRLTSPQATGKQGSFF